MPKTQKEPEIPQPTLGLYIKLGFLAGLILFGVVVLNTIISHKNLESTHLQSKSLESIQKLVSPENLHDKLEREFRTNDGYNKAIQEINTTTDQVLGEATDITDYAVEETKRSATDFVYKQTVVAMIESLLDRMPQRQRDNFKQEYCGKVK